MRPNDADAARLWDMLEYARQVTATTRGLSFEQYMSDANLRLATERRLEIIGEAARRVSPAFQAAHPEVPWRRIVGLRNVLAHEYGDVRQDAVYRIAVVSIPELVPVLEPLIPPAPTETP
jgi:uncharacterized protein with HEPN domain